MKLVYFAHSYRPTDAAVVEHFAKLMQLEGLIASLDPPSDWLNSAKPEKHLLSNDAMVAVLTAREGGPSKYILYEISLGIRSRKPLLVFIEDTIPNGLVPSRILQRRFSRRSLLRQMRTHQHALSLLDTYVGDKPPPLYQPGSTKRSCLLIGSTTINSDLNATIAAEIERVEYDCHPIIQDTSEGDIDVDYESMFTHSFAIILLQKGQSAGALVGAVRGCMLPSIVLTSDREFPYNPCVPQEYQPKWANFSNASELVETIKHEISIYEQEYVDLEDQAKVSAYADMLYKVAQKPGVFSQSTRGVFVQELVMGNRYDNYGQAGAMGDAASGTINNNARLAWSKVQGNTDLSQLSQQLADLRSALRSKSTTVAQDQTLAAVGEAEAKAREGDGPAVMEKLAKAGTWALEVAKEIGVSVAAEALKASMGLG